MKKVVVFFILVASFLSIAMPALTADGSGSRNIVFEDPAPPK